MKKALMMASVASMIDLFNMDNIQLLQEEGYQVEVAANFESGSITSQERVDRFRKELESAGIQVHQLPVPRSITHITEIIRSYRLMKQLCKCRHYDIVHCHSPIGGVVARMACKKERKKGTRVIYTAHGFHFFSGASIKNWMMFYPVERLCARHTDCLITINQEDYNRAKKFPAKDVTYVPGIGMHVNEIQNIQVNSKEKRRALGIEENDFVLMSTGQLSKRKNHEVVIKALSEAKGYNIKYLICGFGELEEYLKDLAKALEVENQVIFAGYRSDVKELLYIVDCFVFPSLQEGLPVALMEAMAAGKPVVCSKIRGNTDLIEDQKGGYVVAPDDVKGIRHGIITLAENAELANEMGKYNQRTIKDFDISNVNEKMKKIYQNLKN